MAYALVSGQTAQAFNSPAAAGTPFTATLTNNPTTGNLVVVLASTSGANTIATFTVQDGAVSPNTYTPTTNSQLLCTNIGNAYVGIWYFIATATANKAISITLSSAAANGLDIWVAEFSGNAASSPLDTDAISITATTNTACTTPSIAPAGSGELFVNIIQPATAITAVNAPWTAIGTFATSKTGAAAAFVINAGSGSEAVNDTQSGTGVWGAIEAAFLPVAAGGSNQGFPTTIVIG